MEDAQNHPIPQDVTGFQFKIIGDMTVKQFTYLAASAVLAWVSYQLPIISFIKLPITIFLGGIGPALAFVPIEGRPMDLMIFSFIKALFNPTRYVYHKSGGGTWLNTVTSQKPSQTKQKPEIKMINIQTPISNKPLNETIQTPIASPTLPNYQAPVSPPPIIQPVTEIPQNQTINTRIVSMHPLSATPQNDTPNPSAQQMEKAEDDKKESLKKRVLDLEKDLEATRKEKTRLEQKQSNLNFPQQPEPLALEKQLGDMLAQKEELTKHLIVLQQKIEMQKSNVFTPTMSTVTNQTQNVKQIPKGMGKNIGLPNTPENPNIITGIIKDPRGNPLGNILVEVKDKEGNPVRAFKTNALGRFVSATALANGEYTVLFEDPKGQNKFDAIRFEAIGEIILPIEVKSIDEREELRKSLFREN